MRHCVGKNNLLFKNLYQINIYSTDMYLHPNLQFDCTMRGQIRVYISVIQRKQMKTHVKDFFTFMSNESHLHEPSSFFN